MLEVLHPFARNPELKPMYFREYARVLKGNLKYGLPLGILIYGSFIGIDILADHPDLMAIAMNRSVICGLALSLYIFNFFDFSTPWIRSAMALLYVVVFLGTMHIALINSIYFTSILAPIIFFNLLIRGNFLFNALATFCLSGLFAYLDIERPSIPEVLPHLLILASTLVVILAAYLKEKTAINEFKQRQAVQAEKQKSFNILLNFLPVEIAQRLQQEEDFIAAEYDSVSIVYLGIVNFTDLSTGISADDMVHRLNACFSMLDNLCEQYALEKIKTIGDTYVATAGIPDRSDNHAVRTARFALAVIQNLDRIRAASFPALSIRIGLHSGPVTGGVIGEKKVFFDIWGDTVNIAARMETTGVPDRIQVSTDFHRSTADRFKYSQRGIIETDIKNHALLETYWLEDVLSLD